MSRIGLVGNRSRVERNWALLAPEAVAESVLPEWEKTVAKIVASPALGAAFAQYDLVLAAGGGTQHTLGEGIEAFLFVFDGDIRCDVNGAGHSLAAGGFAYLKPGSRFMVNAPAGAHLLWLKKRHAPHGTARPHDLVGNERAVPGETYMGMEGVILKTLLPADLAWDMAMNIFTFPPALRSRSPRPTSWSTGWSCCRARGSTTWAGSGWRSWPATSSGWGHTCRSPSTPRGPRLPGTSTTRTCTGTSCSDPPAVPGGRGALQSPCTGPVILDNVLASLAGPTRVARDSPGAQPATSAPLPIGGSVMKQRSPLAIVVLSLGLLVAFASLASAGRNPFGVPAPGQSYVNALRAALPSPPRSRWTPSARRSAATSTRAA